MIPGDNVICIEMDSYDTLRIGQKYIIEKTYHNGTVVDIIDSYGCRMTCYLSKRFIVDNVRVIRKRKLDKIYENRER